MQQEIDVPLVLDAVKQIGNHFLKDFKRSPIPQNRESFLEKLSEIDAHCLSFLKNQLNTEFPDTPWAGDEFDYEQQKQPLPLPQYWYCDSMDGAIQYLQHLPGWTINLTLIREGRTHLAAIYDPLAQEMFWAKEGSGAFLNGEPIQPSTKNHLTDMLAVFEYRHHDSDESEIYQQMGKSVGHLLDHLGIVRNYGPHGLQLAYVGAGRIDLFHQQDLDTYNWLAGILIAKEAGAEILTTDGRPWSWGEKSLMVAPKGVGRLFLEATTQQSGKLLSV